VAEFSPMLLEKSSVLLSFNLLNPTGGLDEWDSTAVKPKKQESRSDMRRSNTGSIIYKRPQLVYPFHQFVWEGHGINTPYEIGDGDIYNEDHLHSPF